MKRFKFSIAWLAMFALVFTSCSKEETGVVSDDSETVQLSFGALLNAFNNQNKQSEVECREGVEPAYVVIGGSTTENAEIDESDLFQVGLVNNNGSWETMYSENLALPAGTYYLQHFVVYDENDEVLWVAPREGGSFADEVDDALPMEIELVAGTKPYIDVDVLCYYAREEVAYGYVFFDLNVIEVDNSYCLFVNYCDDETGRDYPANFRLDVWADGYGGEDLIISDVNDVDIPEEGWPAASVLCVALPEIVGDDLYARITILDDDQAYTPDATDVHDFRISQEDIDSQELFVPAYDHVRINCEDGGTGGGEDPTCDIDIACELDMENELEDYCYYTALEGADEDGFVMISSASDLNLIANLGPDQSQALANLVVSLDDNEVSVELDTPYDETDLITAYSIEVRPSVGAGDGLRMSSTCWESECANVVEEYGTIEADFEGYNYDYPFFIRVNTVNCFTPAEPQ